MSSRARHVRGVLSLGLLLSLALSSGCDGGETPAGPDGAAVFDQGDAVDAQPPAGDAGPPTVDAAPSELDAAAMDAADATAADATAADATAADAEGPDGAQPDTEVVDAQPADAQPADAQPADAQPADAQPADAQPADAAVPAQMQVLLVGNSYVGSNNLNNLLRGFLEDDPLVLDPIVERVSPGGYRLDQHAADADGTNGDTRLRGLLVTGDRQWDWVVLQQQSQIPGFPQGHEMWIAMVDGARVLQALTTENGARTGLMMTWGRRDGDNRNPELYPDFPTMNTRLAEGYRGLAARMEAPVAIGPVGIAFEAIWTRDPAGLFRDLYSNDGSHPALAGSYLAAAVLYRMVTGRSPADRGWAPDRLDPLVAETLRAVAAEVGVE